jgi:hypothetical protein
VSAASPFARNLAGLHRHERALIRFDREHEVEKTRPRITFDVELDAALERRQLVGDLVHVRRRDVALVGARMHGNPGRAGVDARADGLDH